MKKPGNEYVTTLKLCQETMHRFFYGSHPLTAAPSMDPIIIYTSSLYTLRSIQPGRATPLTDQLAAISTKHLHAQAATNFNEENARTAEWDAIQLRGQLGLMQAMDQGVIEGLINDARDESGSYRRSDV
jgi:hypothetical protein